MSEKSTPEPTPEAPLGQISQAPPAFEAFLDRNQKLLIAAGVVLILVLTGWLVLNNVKESAEVTAGNSLVAAEDVTEIQSVVKNHEGTKAAFSAKILLAERQWTDGRQDNSIETLRTFVEAEKEHPARPSALASLAAKLRGQGATGEAEEIFTELTEDPEAIYLAPYAWISLGDMAAEAGETEEAERAYEMVERKFPGSSFASGAMKRRLLLKARRPEEVVAKIEVPDVKFTDDGGEGEAQEPTLPPEGGLETGNLLDALRGANGNNSANPLFPENEMDPVSEEPEGE